MLKSFAVEARSPVRNGVTGFFKLGDLRQTPLPDVCGCGTSLADVFFSCTQGWVSVEGNTPQKCAVYPGQVLVSFPTRWEVLCLFGMEKYNMKTRQV